MSRSPSLIAAGVVLLLGCATPGYRVSVMAKGIDLGELDPLVTRMENKAKGSGFATVAERRESRAPIPPGFTSSYSKVLSERPHDYTAIDVHYFAPESSLQIEIHNLLRGMEPPIKAEIDALGDDFAAELSKTVGRERVSVEKGPASRTPF